MKDFSQCRKGTRLRSTITNPYRHVGEVVTVESVTTLAIVYIRASGESDVSFLAPSWELTNNLLTKLKES